VAARRSRLAGNFHLRRTLRNIHGQLDNELKPAMREAADRILATMLQQVPRSGRSDADGHAADALEAFVSKSGLDAQIGLRGLKDNRRYFYLKFLEYGTKGYTGGKRSGNRNQRDVNKSDGTHFYGKHPNIPARPAHPWLRPAYDVNKEFVLANIRAAVANTLRRASEELGNG
jgi:HK97 gp10 family phage protein